MNLETRVKITIGDLVVQLQAKDVEIELLKKQIEELKAAQKAE